MAATITATSGSATANSYLTLSAAQKIIDESSDPSASTWDTATEDTKNRALITATRRLDTENYTGYRTTDTQALAWPRTGAPRADSYQNTGYYQGYSYSYLEPYPNTRYYATDEIPDRIKQATADLAINLVTNADSLSLSGLEQYTRVKIGPLEVEPVQPQKTALLPLSVRRSISPLLSYSTMSAPLYRS